MSYYGHRKKCAVCGEKAKPGDPLTKGHIIPRSRGGSDEPWNIQPEHASCNLKRMTFYTRDDAAKSQLNKNQFKKEK